MSLAECATAALGFPDRNVATSAGTLPLGLMMLCVGGPESSWAAAAQGDYGLSGPACNGYTSWGWLQIHSVHAGTLTQLSGSASPCDWAAWLYDPANTVIMAMQILGLRASYSESQITGPGAPWSADGPYWQGYLAQAQPAWDAALAALPPPGLPPPPLPPGGPLAAFLAVLGLSTAAAVGGGVALGERVRASRGSRPRRER